MPGGKSPDGHRQRCLRPRRNSMALTGGLPGWDRPAVWPTCGRRSAGSLVVENDVDAAALARRTLRHGGTPTVSRSSRSAAESAWAWWSAVSCTGAGTAWLEIPYLPLGSQGADPGDASAGAAGGRGVPSGRGPRARGPVCRARSPHGGSSRPQRPGDSGPPPSWPGSRNSGPGAVLRGDHRRPALIVLGGRVRRAQASRPRSPANSGRSLIMPEVGSGALGTDVVVHGCAARAN